MSPTARRSGWLVAARAGFALVALGAFANAVRHADVRRAAGLVASIGPIVLVVVAPWGVAMGLQAFGYARILGALRRAASFPRLLSVVLSAEALLMSFPAGAAVAETSSVYLLNRRCGVPTPEALAVVAAKKSLIVLTNAIYMGIAVALGAEWLRSASRALIGGPGLSWVVTAVAAVVLVASLAMSRALFSGSLASRSHRLLARVPSRRLKAWLAGVERGFTAVDEHFVALMRGRGRALVVAAAAFLCGWLVEGAEAWLILTLLHVPVSYAEVLAFEVVVSLLKSLAFMVPAGLGVQDAGYVAFFAAFGIPDAPTVGVAFILVKRAKEVIWISIGLSMFALLRDSPARTTQGSIEQE